MAKVTKKILSKAIALIAIATTPACANSSPSTIETSGLVNVGEITQNIDSYIGRSVLVRNDVIKTIGAKGLILDKDRAFGGDTILVINQSPIPFALPLKNTPEVLVKGTVERLVLTDKPITAFQQKYNLDLDSKLYQQYENQPVIIADSLILSPDPEDLTQNAADYYDLPLAIKGEIEDVTSYGVFELDEEQAFGGEDLAVVQSKPKIKLSEDKMAIVYGKLRPFIASELERDYDLGWDLSIQREIEQEYSQKSILVAEEIQLLQSQD